MRLPPRVVVVSVVALLSSCTGSVGEPPGGAFTVDPPPGLVTSPALTLTGKKASGSGVAVNGAEQVAVSAQTTWSVDLTLSEGVNHFDVGPLDAAGTVGETVAVDVTLDSVAPTVATRRPSSGATGVALNAAIEAVFSEEVDCATLTTAVFQVRNVTSTLTCATAGGVTTARLTPGANLAASTGHTVLLMGAGAVKDLAGNAMAADVSWQFTTGTVVDTTPPAPPTFDSPAPPSGPTFNLQERVGGTKETNASVEFRWTANSALRQDWTEAAQKTGATSWAFDFQLDVGTNVIELRSVDLASNVSPVVSFSVTRQPSTTVVAAPTLNAVVTPTTVGNQVLSGTRAANTSVWNGTTQLVPLGASTTWTALVSLSAGANDFDLVAKDSTGSVSQPAPRQTISYNPAGPVTAGQVKIELEVRDMFPFIGDEFSASATGTDIDHFAFDVWIEGPLTKTGPGAYERCVFDTARRQRRHIRYVGSVSHSKGQGCTASTADCQNGFFWDLDYRSPNYLAALIESGRWSSTPPTAFPFVRDVQRRDPATGEQWDPSVSFDSAAGHNMPNHPELWFPNYASCCGWGAKPKIFQPPIIDGVTEASTNAMYNPTTRTTPDGGTLGTWALQKTYRWSLKDFSNAFVEKGPYLVNITVNVDRAGPGDTSHHADLRATDQETCWDDPTQDDTGAHRAEGIVEIDGATASTLYLKEKARLELVNACVEQPTGNTNRVRCTCGASTAFPCPALPNTATGQRVLYLTPGKFTNPADSQGYAVRVQYCPTGPCP